MAEHKRKTETEMLNLFTYAEELQNELKELYDTEDEIRLFTDDGFGEETAEPLLSDADKMELVLATASEERLRLSDKALDGLNMLDRSVSGSSLKDPACGTCALQFMTVVKGAALCVYCSSDSMKNREKAKKMNTAARKNAELAEKTAQKIYDRVMRAITLL